MMVGTKDGDEFVGTGRSVEFVFMIGNVAGDIGQSSVTSAEDSIHVVAEFCGA